MRSSRRAFCAIRWARSRDSRGSTWVRCSARSSRRTSSSGPAAHVGDRARRGARRRGDARAYRREPSRQHGEAHPGDRALWVRLEPRDHGLELVVEDDGPACPKPTRSGSSSVPPGPGVGHGSGWGWRSSLGSPSCTTGAPGSKIGRAAERRSTSRSPRNRAERPIDLTEIEPDQPTETGSSADNHA